jgi:hypothetical protein
MRVERGLAIAIRTFTWYRLNYAGQFVAQVLLQW